MFMLDFMKRAAFITVSPLYYIAKATVGTSEPVVDATVDAAKEEAERLAIEAAKKLAEESSTWAAEEAMRATKEAALAKAIKEKQLGDAKTSPIGDLNGTCDIADTADLNGTCVIGGTAAIRTAAEQFENADLNGTCVIGGTTADQFDINGTCVIGGTAAIRTAAEQFENADLDGTCVIGGTAAAIGTAVKNNMKNINAENFKLTNGICPLSDAVPSFVNSNVNVNDTYKNVGSDESTLGSYFPYAAAGVAVLETSRRLYNRIYQNSSLEKKLGTDFEKVKDNPKAKKVLALIKDQNFAIKLVKSKNKDEINALVTELFSTDAKLKEFATKNPDTQKNIIQPYFDRKIADQEKIKVEQENAKKLVRSKTKSKTKPVKKEMGPIIKEQVDVLAKERTEKIAREQAEAIKKAKRDLAKQALLNKVIEHQSAAETLKIAMEDMSEEEIAAHEKMSPVALVQFLDFLGDKQPYELKDKAGKPTGIMMKRYGMWLKMEPKQRLENISNLIKMGVERKTPSSPSKLVTPPLSPKSSPILKDSGKGKERMDPPSSPLKKSLNNNI